MKISGQIYYVSQSGHWAPSAVTEKALSEALEFAKNKDAQGLEKLIASGIYFPLINGMEVEVIERKPSKGLVKIRPVGMEETVRELWTFSEYLSKEKP